MSDAPNHHRPDALQMLRRMDTLATAEFGDDYTITLTGWTDGDHRIVAYSVTDSPHPETAFIELWYQYDEWERNDWNHNQAMRVKTLSEDADVPRGDTRQFQRGETEWVAIPPDPAGGD